MKTLLLALGLFLPVSLFATDDYTKMPIGDFYANGVGVEKDPSEAAKWFLKAAEQGDVIAERNLGICYYTSQIGTKTIDFEKEKKDQSEAVKWFLKAAGIMHLTEVKSWGKLAA
jgi:hypothetical protein